MKALASALLWLLLFPCLVSCTQPGQTPPSPSAQPAPQPEQEPETEESEQEESTVEEIFYITAGGRTFAARFESNSSADALRQLLAQGDLTVDMSDYGDFEKVGSLGRSLPTNDRSITTQPGDVILYQGSSITIYYGTNTWNFTRLGRVENITKEELLQALGQGDVQVTFSLTPPQAHPSKEDDAR